MSSSSTGRRSTINTSRGRPTDSSLTSINGPSTSSDRITAAAPEEDDDIDDEENEQDQQQQVGIRIEDVQTLLREFDQSKFPLSKNSAELSLKNYSEHWQMEQNSLDDLIATLGDLAEHRAESISEENGNEDDKTLVKFEKLCCEYLDARQESEIRRDVLNSIRESVGRGEDIEDAAELYQTTVEQRLTEWRSKTKRQRLGQSEQYEKYRQRVWGALTDVTMPPLMELIKAEKDDVEVESDDIITYGGASIQQYKCPLTLRIMTDPLRSTVCPHAYEKAAILEFLGSATKPCPSGCTSRINKRLLKEDQNFTKECKSFARRQDRRQQRDREHIESTALD